MIDKRERMNLVFKSDSNHDCCKGCQVAPKDYKCFSSPNYIECVEEHSYCDGVRTECPSQRPKRENTTCHSLDQGKCSSTGQCLSLCQQTNAAFLQCKCADEPERCMICCRNVFAAPSDGIASQCRPIHQVFAAQWRAPLYMSDGRSCFDGLCENVSFVYLDSP